MSRRSVAAAALVVALLAALVAFTELDGSAPAGSAADGGARGRGTTLPAVTLPPLTDGPALDLAALRGPVVVSFWASWCPPCRRELPILQEFSTKHAGSVDVVGIDYLDPQVDAARSLAAEAGVTYPLVADVHGVVSGQGAVPRLRGLPYLALVDADGTVVFGGYVAVESLAQLESLVEQHLGVST